MPMMYKDDGTLECVTCPAIHRKAKRITKQKRKQLQLIQGNGEDHDLESAQKNEGAGCDFPDVGVEENVDHISHSHGNDGDSVSSGTQNLHDLEEGRIHTIESTASSAHDHQYGVGAQSLNSTSFHQQPSSSTVGLNPYEDGSHLSRSQHSQSMLRSIHSDNWNRPSISIQSSHHSASQAIPEDGDPSDHSQNNPQYGSVSRSHGSSEISTHCPRHIPSGDGSIHHSNSNQHPASVSAVSKSFDSSIVSSHEPRSVPPGDGSTYHQHCPANAADQVRHSQSNQHNGSMLGVSKSQGSSDVSCHGPTHVLTIDGKFHHDHYTSGAEQVNHSQSNQFPGSSSDVSEYRGSSEASSTRCPRNMPSGEGEMIYQYYQPSAVAQEATMRQSYSQNRQLQLSASAVSRHEESSYPPSVPAGDVEFHQQQPAATGYHANQSDAQCQRSSSEVSECHNLQKSMPTNETIRHQNRPNLVVEVGQPCHPNQNYPLEQPMSEMSDDRKSLNASVDGKPHATFSSGTDQPPEHRHVHVNQRSASEVSESSEASLNRCPRNIPPSEMIYSPSCSKQPALVYPVQSVASHLSDKERAALHYQANETQPVNDTLEPQLPKQVNTNMPILKALGSQDQWNEVRCNPSSEADRYLYDNVDNREIRVDKRIITRDLPNANSGVMEQDVPRDTSVVMKKQQASDNPEILEVNIGYIADDARPSNHSGSCLSADDTRAQEDGDHSGNGSLPFLGYANDSLSARSQIGGASSCQDNAFHLDMGPNAKASAAGEGENSPGYHSDDLSKLAIEDDLNGRITRLAEALKEVADRLPPKDNSDHGKAETSNQSRGASPGQMHMRSVEKRQHRPPPYPTNTSSPSIHSVHSEGIGRKESIDSMIDMRSEGVAKQTIDQYALDGDHLQTAPSREEFQAAQGIMDLMDHGAQSRSHFIVMGSPLHQMKSQDLSEKSSGTFQTSNIHMYENSQVNTSFQGANYHTLMSPVVMAGFSQGRQNRNNSMYDMSQLNTSFQEGYRTLLSPLVQERFSRTENLPFVPASARSQRSISSWMHGQSEPRSADVLHPIQSNNNIAIPISPITVRPDDKQFDLFHDHRESSQEIKIKNRAIRKQKKSHSRRHRSDPQKHRADPPGRTLKATDDEVRDPPDDLSAQRELRESHPKHPTSISPFRSKTSSESHLQNEPPSKHAKDPPDSSEMIQRSRSIILNSTTPKSKGRRPCIDQHVSPVQTIDFSELPLLLSKAATPKSNRQHDYFTDHSNSQQPLLIANQESHLFTDDVKTPASQRQHDIFKPNSATKEQDENVDSSNSTPVLNERVKLCAMSSWDDHEVLAPIQPARSFGESSLDHLFHQIDEIEDDFNTIVASIPGSGAHTIASSLKSGSVCGDAESVKSINDKHALVEITLNNAASFESNASEGSSMVTDVVQRMRRIKDYIERIDSVESEGDGSVHSIYSQDEMSELMQQLTNAAESLRALHTDWDD